MTMHWNLKTSPIPCDHNTEPKPWVQGRVDSGRRLFFVEIGGMSWHWDHYVPTAKRAELIEQCFADWAARYGRTTDAPRYFGSSPAADFRHREARIYIRPDDGKPWRGAYRLNVTMVDHTPDCYA